MVTADGELREIGPGDELFAALRGGRSVPGVVTSLTVGLVGVTTVVGGGLFLDAAAASAVLPVVRRLGLDAPETLGLSLGVVPVPDLEAVPAPIRGRTVLHVRLVDTDGSSARAAEAEVRAAARVLLGDLREMPWTGSGSIVAEPEVPHTYEGTNVLVRELSDSALAAVVERAGDAVLDVRRLGGALARPAVGPDAVSFREAAWIVRVITAGTGADHGRVLAPLDDEALGTMAAFVYGGARAPLPCREPRVAALLDRVFGA